MTTGTRGPWKLLWLPLLGAALFFGGPFGGCPCITEPRLLFHADWEDCAGLCGWEVVAGEARVVQTFHPAEHALQFVGDRTVVRHDLGVGTSTCTAYECSEQVVLVTNCWGPPPGFPAGQPGPRIAAQVRYANPAGAEQTYSVGFDCSRTGGSLRSCTAGIGISIEDADGGDPWTLAGITIESSQDGCIVDHLAVEIVETHC